MRVPSSLRRQAGLPPSAHPTPRLSPFTTAFLLLSCILVQPATAAVSLQGTRIVHDAAKGRDASVAVTNRGDRPALVQAWLDDGNSQARPENVRTPFVLTPAAPRAVKPHQGQAYRITYAPRPTDTPLPADRESVFYFNLLDIPPAPADTAGSNLLQFAVRTRIKLFHRPAGLVGRPHEAAAALHWANGPAATVQVHNPTAFHVTLAHITTPAGQELKAEMIPPQGTLSIALPPGLLPPSALTFHWLDDFGVQRQAQAIVQPPSVSN